MQGVVQSSCCLCVFGTFFVNVLEMYLRTFSSLLQQDFAVLREQGADDAHAREMALNLRSTVRGLVLYPSFTSISFAFIYQSCSVTICGFFNLLLSSARQRCVVWHVSRQRFHSEGFWEDVSRTMTILDLGFRRLLSLSF